MSLERTSIRSTYAAAFNVSQTLDAVGSLATDALGGALENLNTALGEDKISAAAVSTVAVAVGARG